MDEYFTCREQISLVISLVDSRHEPTGDDVDMIDYLKELGIPILVVATKIDKVPKTKRIKALKVVSQKLQLPLNQILPVSSTEKTGFEPVYEKIQSMLESQS